MKKAFITSLAVIGIVGTISFGAYAHRGEISGQPGQRFEMGQKQQFQEGRVGYGRSQWNFQRQSEISPQLVTEENAREIAEAYIKENLSGYTVDTIEKDNWRPLYFITLKAEDEKTAQIVVHGLAGQVVHDSVKGWLPGMREQRGGQQQGFQVKRFIQPGQNMQGQLQMRPRGGQQIYRRSQMEQQGRQQAFLGAQQMRGHSQMGQQGRQQAFQGRGFMPSGSNMPGRQGMMQPAVTEDKAKEVAEEYIKQNLPGYTVNLIEKDEWRPLYFATVSNTDGATLQMAIHGFGGQIMHLSPTAAK